jgi:hypothetical protein
MTAMSKAFDGFPDALTTRRGFDVASVCVLWNSLYPEHPTARLSSVVPNEIGRV